MASNKGGILAGEAYVSLDLTDDEYRVAMKLALQQLKQFDKTASLVVTATNRISRALSSAATRIRVFGRVINTFIGSASKFSRLVFDTLAPSLFFLGATAAGMGATILGAVRPAAKAFASLEDVVSRFRIVFGDQAAATEQWARSFAKSIGYADSTVLDVMGRFQALLTTQGVPQAVATGASKGLAELVPNLASFFEMQPDDVITRLFSGLVGEMEAVRRLGVDLSAQAVNSRLEEFGINPQEATQAQKAIARYNIIVDQTKVAQADLQKTSNSLANTIVRLNEAWKRTKETIGGALAPALTSVANIASRALSNLQPLLKTKQFQKMATVFVGIGAGLAVIGTASVTIAPLVTAIGSLASFATAAAGTMSTLAFTGLAAVTAGTGAAVVAISKLGIVFNKVFGGDVVSILSNVAGILKEITSAIAGVFKGGGTGGIAGLLGFGGGGGTSPPSSPLSPFRGGPPSPITPPPPRSSVGALPRLGVRSPRDIHNAGVFANFFGKPKPSQFKPVGEAYAEAMKEVIIDAEYAIMKDYKPRIRGLLTGPPVPPTSLTTTGARSATQAGLGEIGSTRSLVGEFVSAVKNLLSAIRTQLRVAIESAGSKLRGFASSVSEAAKTLFRRNRVFQFGYTPKTPANVGFQGGLIRRSFPVGSTGSAGPAVGEAATAASKAAAEVSSKIFSTISTSAQKAFSSLYGFIRSTVGAVLSSSTAFRVVIRTLEILRSALRSIVVFEAVFQSIKMVASPALSVLSDAISSLASAASRVVGSVGGLAGGLFEVSRVAGSALSTLADALIAGDVQKAINITKAGFNVLAKAASISFRIIASSFGGLFDAMGNAIDGLITSAKFLAAIVTNPLEFAKKITAEGPTRVAIQRDVALEKFLSKKTGRGLEDVRVIGQGFAFNDGDGFKTAGVIGNEDLLSREFAHEYSKQTRDITKEVNIQIAKELADGAFGGAGSGLASTIGEEFAKSKAELIEGLRPELEALQKAVTAPPSSGGNGFGNIPAANPQKQDLSQIAGAMAENLKKVADGASRIAQTASITDSSARSRFGSADAERTRLMKQQLAALQRIRENTEDGLQGVGL